MFNNISLSEILIRFPVVLLALSVHEFAHGFAAYILGDHTAKYDGRLSLNPLRHLDPVGFFCLLVFSFGWAKPVMVNPTNFRDPKTDMALTSFAGPLSNFILAFVLLLIYYPLWYLGYFSQGGFAMQILDQLLLSGVGINISLGVFNMIPFPPLDGSKIFTAVLPDHLYYRFLSLSRYSFIILLALMWMGVFEKILMPMIDVALAGYFFLAQLIYSFL